MVSPEAEENKSFIVYNKEQLNVSTTSRTGFYYIWIFVYGIMIGYLIIT